MAQLPISKEYNTFVQGLITEASPLNFPEHASFDEDNFDLNKRGYRQRRLGMEYEDQYRGIALTSGEYSALDRNAVSTYIWKNVGNDPELSILVVQFGRGLRFFDYSKDTISDFQLNGGVTLTLSGGFIAPLGMDAKYQFSYAQINGDLLVVGGDDCVYRLYYNEDEDSVSVEIHGLLVRDIWGVDDGLSPRQRTQSVETEVQFLAINNDEHTYNLMNQGWYKSLSNGKVSDTLLDQYFEAYPGNESLLFQVYPSNGDAPYKHYDPTDQTYLQAVTEAHLIPNQLAPRGSVVIDLFYRGLSRQWTTAGYSIDTNFELSEWGEGVSGAMSRLILVGEGTIFTEILSGELPYDWTRSGIYNIATYAGRVFYSGIFPKYADPLVEGDNLSPSIGGYIFYSQLVDGSSKIGKCYQEGDPTSEEEFDLVDTDGGFIAIPEMSIPIQMVTLANSLVIFADNGIWEITGGQSGFSATNNQVRKISDVGVIGKSAIVKVESSIYFWSEGGVYQLTYDVNSLNFIVNNITSQSIQSFYNDIGAAGKVNATGAYDPSKKVITWLFNSLDSNEYDGVSYRFNYNRALNLDLTLNSFYPYTFYNADVADPPMVSGIFITDKEVSTESTANVTVNGENVTVNGDQVTITDTLRAPIVSQSKYLISRINYTPDPLEEATSQYFTFGLLKNDSFEDFLGTAHEADCPATITTGVALLGETQRQKQAKYFTAHFERTETGFTSDGSALDPSSCLVTPIWDFSTHANSGKTGTQFQAYRLNRQYFHTGPIDTFEYGKSVITTKSKLRGRGRGLAFKFDTEPQKDLIIYGWAVTYLGNTEE